MNRIDPALARSWLLVNADRPAALDAALGSAADALVLDLEDAVDPAAKPSAGERVAEWLGAHRAWVRVNDATTPFWADDLARLRDAPGLAGVVLAKTESADQVSATRTLLGGSVPVVALIESALGIEDVTAIARAGAFRLAFGSGDYRRDTGVTGTPLALAYCAPGSPSPPGPPGCPARSMGRAPAPTPPRSTSTPPSAPRSA